MDPATARARGLTSTVSFPRGNLAPEGSVIKSTAIDPSVVGRRRRLPQDRPGARLQLASAPPSPPSRARAGRAIQAGDMIVLAGVAARWAPAWKRPTSSPPRSRYLPWGKQVALITDARFSGVCTGACIGHVGPEALAGGPHRQGASTAT